MAETTRLSQETRCTGTLHESELGSAVWMTDTYHRE